MQFIAALRQYGDLRVGGLSVEFTMLSFAIILGIVQLFLAAQFVTAERGVAWNMGPRDETAPLKSKLAGRLDRAFWNFLETFPFFAVLVLMTSVLGRHSWLTVSGSQLYVAARVIYVPLYAFGVTGLRTLAFLAATAGILMLIASLLLPNLAMAGH